MVLEANSSAHLFISIIQRHQEFEGNMKYRKRVKNVKVFSVRFTQNSIKQTETNIFVDNYTYSKLVRTKPTFLNVANLLAHLS